MSDLGRQRGCGHEGRKGFEWLGCGAFLLCVLGDGSFEGGQFSYSHSWESFAGVFGLGPGGWGCEAHRGIQETMLGCGPVAQWPSGSSCFLGAGSLLLTFDVAQGQSGFGSRGSE